MQIQELSIAEIVTTKPETAALFEKYNLDFCCKGKQKLKDALSNDKSKLDEVTASLEKIFSSSNSGEIDFNSFSLSKLIDYIITYHHAYVKEGMPIIMQHLVKVVEKHGELYPNMKSVAKIFKEIQAEFEHHMLKEELILFPKIKKLEQGIDVPNFGTAETIIKVMENEHSESGKLMSEIKALSNDFIAPENSCVTFKVCMGELKAFETDLHKHIHLENNILFPKAINLQNNDQFRSYSI